MPRPPVSQLSTDVNVGSNLTGWGSRGIEKHFFTNAILRDACSVLGWMNLTWMMAGPTGVGAMGKQWFLRSGGNYTLAVDSGCRGLMQTVTVGLFQWIKGSK